MMQTQHKISLISESSDIQNSSLYKLLNEPVPRLGKIKQAILHTEPAVIQELIREEPLSIFILDYYLRKFESTVAEHVINHPDLPLETLVELFNCQIIRYFMSNTYKEEKSYATRVHFMDSYWSRLSREKLQDLFQALLQAGESNQISALGIMGNLSIQDLSLLRGNQSQVLMDFIKNRRGELGKYLTANLDLFDFLHKEARNLEDQEMLAVLDEFTELIVLLRISNSFADEGRELADENKQIAFVDLVDLIKRIPPDSAEMTMRLLERDGYIGKEIMLNLMRFLKSEGLL